MKEHPKNRFVGKISRGFDSFTPSDRKIADYLLSVYPLGLLQNAAEIAEELELTASTVVRFFPKIGYDNIKEARADFSEDIRFLINSPADRVRSENGRLDSNDTFGLTMEQDIANIRETISSIDIDVVNRFVDLMSESSRDVYILGTRKEASVSRYFSYQLSSFHKSVKLLDPSNMVDQLAEFTPNDILVVFDFRRYSSYHMKACEYVTKHKGNIVVFADSPISPSAQYTDCLFLIKTTGLSAFDSYTPAFTIINALGSILVEKNADLVGQKYETLESLYEHFDIFTYQNHKTSN
ncbi:MurR/RpiR family transcriptional regulator [Photobacterium sp. DNB23_23_1]|uniref:MurR/RpiR family transcriptional regulator n=1 Tax=Photobacterium pectinilyticum TaxID=2906793 RepID=A0ABT1N2C3_9GAMM|nr:MurR/RpiR family transcriptional regulator [Photobacterium sp. ZSDE20]MCQ1058890.1 MurR/RpiR family transcriptional regulator [Photobacterium sp. ZSDE20]MDD1823820.1 MurR/RpiR family transcriptional regulator [Photobacterium sp. ZSDE20]